MCKLSRFYNIVIHVQGILTLKHLYKAFGYWYKTALSDIQTFSIEYENESKLLPYPLNLKDFFNLHLLNSDGWSIRLGDKTT